MPLKPVVEYEVIRDLYKAHYTPREVSELLSLKLGTVRNYYYRFRNTHMPRRSKAVLLSPHINHKLKDKLDAFETTAI